MKQIENTLQDLKCMLIEDGYTEANIVMRTLIKVQEQVKKCSTHNVSQQRELLLAYENYTSKMITGKTNDRTAKSLVNDFLANYSG